MNDSYNTEPLLYHTKKRKVYDIRYSFTVSFPYLTPRGGFIGERLAIFRPICTGLCFVYATLMTATNYIIKD